MFLCFVLLFVFVYFTNHERGCDLQLPSHLTFGLAIYCQKGSLLGEWSWGPKGVSAQPNQGYEDQKEYL